MSIKNLSLLLFLSVLSCARVRIKDGEWCGDMGEMGASCFHTLSDGHRDLAPLDWETERFGMICTKAENFGEWKKAILKLCKISKACTYDVKKAVVKFNDNVQTYVVKLHEDGRLPPDVHQPELVSCQ